MKKILKMVFSRLVIVGVLIAVQLLIVIAMVVRFEGYFVDFYAICVLLSVIVVLKIINGKENPAYKIAWLIPILLMPIFGGLFYLIFGGTRLNRRERKKMSIIANNFNEVAGHIRSAQEEMEQEDAVARMQSRYITDYSYCPPYQGTYTEYLPLGEIKFQRMLEELRGAKHFIFMEYFIIEHGIMWNAILEVLEEKAKAGLDVRVMYDDMGTIMTLPSHYKLVLESKGIQCCVFNPFIPVLSSRFNNRDHRKICVIDGYIGFTGGINLADEYINAYAKHGHWKDTALLLKGEAVWSLTMMFLSMWDFVQHTHEDFAQFLPSVHQPEPYQTDGYVQPYSDNPLDDEPVGETVYMNLIHKAKRYVYITSPYLIISNEMVTALCIAAKSGVDVRIVTPHHADKWFVHAVTRAYYETLVEAGVEIYEYTPGFIHAKTFVVDDEYGVVGTINLDYRSLYLHFECAAWLYRTSSVLSIKEDFLKTQEVCQRITLDECQNVAWYRKMARAVLRVFAPLM